MTAERTTEKKTTRLKRKLKMQRKFGWIINAKI